MTRINLKPECGHEDDRINLEVDVSEDTASQAAYELDKAVFSVVNKLKQAGYCTQLTSLVEEVAA